jgi:hypothetical protein
MASGWTRWIKSAIILGVTLAGGEAPAWAGEKSLIAGFRTGDEVRYAFNVSNDETTSIAGKTGVGAQSLSTEKVVLVVRCKAETIPLCILEVVYESFHIELDTPSGRVEVDLGAAAPDAGAPQLARDLYQHLHGIVGTTLTINTAPGSGEITQYRGGEQLLKTPGTSVLRRYVDKELFTATFGPILQLKSNTASPPPGQEWWVQRNVFAYAHPGKTPIWETRVVDNVLADIATIKGTMRATGNAEGSEKAPALFKSVSGNAVYTWDLFRGRLVSVNRTEVINSRFAADKATKDSDLVSKSTLTLVPPPVKAADAPTTRPPPEKAAPDAKGAP